MNRYSERFGFEVLCAKAGPNMETVANRLASLLERNGWKGTIINGFQLNTMSYKDDVELEIGFGPDETPDPNPQPPTDEGRG